MPHLIALGRELTRQRRRCRRLRTKDWTAWSAAVEETNSLARRIGRMQPGSLAELLVLYEALHWQLLEADDVIVDLGARRAFIGYGRALRRMAGP